jgi:hypothetical protein
MGRLAPGQLPAGELNRLALSGFPCFFLGCEEVVRRASFSAFLCGREVQRSRWRIFLGAFSRASLPEEKISGVCISSPLYDA